MSFATAGPSVNQAPVWIALRKPNASTMTHSQVMERNSVQPSRSSCSVLLRSAGAGFGGIVTGVSRSAATSHVNASTASAQPDPTVTTSSAPTVGPMIVRPPRDSDSSALALCSCSRGTSCGTMLAIAGNEMADTSPCTADSAMTIQSSAVPVITRNAMAPCVNADVRFDSCSTTARGKRSATTPPKSRNSTIGIVCAAST